MNQSTYTAVIQQKESWWIGWVKEIPGVNCQEPTKEKLLESLKVTLDEALEMNRHDAIRSIDSEYEEVLIQV